MYVRVITGLPLSDPTGGYKLFRRSALQSLNLEAIKSNGYSFQIELSHKLWREGKRICETPIVFLDRFHSRVVENVEKDRARGARHGVAAVVPERPAPFAAREAGVKDPRKPGLQ
jgi:hypothetical protein